MNQEIIDYDIITGENVRSLVSRLIESKKHGWVPQGGVAFDPLGYPVQAVVKFKSPNQ